MKITTKMKILNHLKKHGNMTAAQLKKQLKVSQSALYKNLNKLRGEHLVHVNPENRFWSAFGAGPEVKTAVKAAKDALDDALRGLHPLKQPVPEIRDENQYSTLVMPDQNEGRQQFEALAKALTLNENAIYMLAIRLVQNHLRSAVTEGL